MVSPEQTVAVAVIGVTGSGKSTFINVASGSNLPVDKSFGGCTTELQSSTCRLDGRTVILIDTPGFGDMRPGILGVLQSISQFAGLNSQGIKLAGVIYMHCITQDHMCGPSGHNFRVFSKFCGESSLRDVLIVTNQQGLANKDRFFGPAIDKGARMVHHDGSQASAHVILRHLLDRGGKLCPPPEESLTQKTDPSRTTTGLNAVRGPQRQVERQTGDLCQRIDAPTPAKDDDAREISHEEAKNSSERREHIRCDLEHMVTNVATESSRLEDDNRRGKAQQAEAELGIRLLGEERKARELAEAARERAEAQLAEERALWERENAERGHAMPTYDKVFACGAIFFVLLCVSRFALHGSPSLL